MTETKGAGLNKIRTLLSELVPLCANPKTPLPLDPNSPYVLPQWNRAIPHIDSILGTTREHKSKDHAYILWLFLPYRSGKRIPSASHIMTHVIRGEALSSFVGQQGKPDDSFCIPKGHGWLILDLNSLPVDDARSR